MKMIDRENITAEYVRSILRYDPETGELLWKNRDISDFKSKNSWSRWNNRYAGKQAGASEKNGRIIIRIFKVTYFAHRLAFLIMTGVWPKEQVDHIDGNQSNNRWVNLRECFDFENKQNLKKRADSGNKYPGVYKRVQKYKDREYIHYDAQVRCKGEKFRENGFSTEREAYEAYLRMKEKVHSFNPSHRGN